MSRATQTAATGSLGFLGALGVKKLSTMPRKDGSWPAEHSPGSPPLHPKLLSWLLSETNPLAGSRRNTNEPLTEFTL